MNLYLDQIPYYTADAILPPADDSDQYETEATYIEEIEIPEPTEAPTEKATEKATEKKTNTIETTADVEGNAKETHASTVAAENATQAGSGVPGKDLTALYIIIPIILVVLISVISLVVVSKKKKAAAAKPDADRQADIDKKDNE